MVSQTEAFFSNFYQKWMAELEGILRLLLDTSIINPTLDPAAYAAAIKKFTSHHREYYRIKSAAVHDDAKAFLNPVWLSSFESAHLWISGWRPSTALSLLGPDRFSGLTEDQVEKIASLRAKVKLEEQTVEREKEKQQLRMGGGLANYVGRGSVGLVQETADGLEKVINMADTVRGLTLRDVISNLSPMQAVKFFTDFTMLQIRTRELGKQMGNKN